MKEGGECRRRGHRKIDLILMTFLQSSTEHVPKILTSASQKCLEYLLSIVGVIGGLVLFGWEGLIAGVLTL